MEVINNLLLDKKQYNQTINNNDYIIINYTIADQAQLVITTREEDGSSVSARLIDLKEEDRKYGVITLINDDNNYYLEYVLRTVFVDVSVMNDLNLELSKEKRIVEALLTILLNHDFKVISKGITQ